MRDEVKYAVLIGRLIELLQRGGDPTTEDHRTALRALVELAGQRSTALRLESGTLSVEGFALPDDTPYLNLVKERLTIHGLAAVHVVSDASAVDLIQMLKALAEAPSGEHPGLAFEERLRRAKITAISVITSDLRAATRDRRSVRVTDALRATGMMPEMKEGDMGVLPAEKGAAYDEMVRHQRATSNSLAGAVSRLQAPADVITLRNDLEAVQAGIVKAVAQNELDRAFEATIKLIRQEADAPNADVRRSYGIALRRILSGDLLTKLAPRALDDVYAQDVVTIMRRAGTAGTKVLLDRLIEAPTQAERKAYLRALQQIEEGLDVVTSLLSHHEWFVVRNAADLVGELGIAEAVPALGKVVTHHDPRVRLSVGIALAKIGTPVAGQHLRKVFHDEDPKVRLTVVKLLGGKGLGGLAMPLVSAAEGEEDEAIVAEYYRALGRIGTPDAVQALSKAARASGSGFLSRKAGPARLAAVEALGSAGGPVAVEALQALAKSRAGDLRKAAVVALEHARATSG